MALPRSRLPSIATWPAACSQIQRALMVLASALIDVSGSFGSLGENRVDRGLAIFGEVFESFDRLETEAAKERQRGIANCGEHLRGMAGVGSRLIFTATDIANVMQLIFDAPVIAR